MTRDNKYDKTSFERTSNGPITMYIIITISIINGLKWFRTVRPQTNKNKTSSTGARGGLNKQSIHYRVHALHCDIALTQQSFT